MGYDDLICKNCNSGLMENHPENELWDKCELCGFSELRARSKSLGPRAFALDSVHEVKIADELPHRSAKGSNKYKRD